MANLEKLVIEPRTITLAEAGAEAPVRIMGKYQGDENLRPLPQEYLPMLKIESQSPEIFRIKQNGNIEALTTGTGTLHAWLLDKKTDTNGTVVVGGTQLPEADETGTDAAVTGTEASFRDQEIVKIQMIPASIIITPGRSGSPDRVLVTHQTGQQTTLGSDSEEVEYELERMIPDQLAHWVTGDTDDLAAIMNLGDGGNVTVPAYISTTSVWLVARYRGHTTRTRVDVRSLENRDIMAQNQCQEDNPLATVMIEHRDWTGHEEAWSTAALGGNSVRIYPEFRGIVIEFPCDEIGDMSNALHKGGTVHRSLRTYPFHKTPGDNQPPDLEPAVDRGETLLRMEQGGSSLSLPVYHVLTKDGSLVSLKHGQALSKVPTSSDTKVVVVAQDGRSITPIDIGTAIVTLTGTNGTKKTITVVVSAP